MAPTRSAVEVAWRNAALLLVLFAIGAAPILVNHGLTRAAFARGQVPRLDAAPPQHGAVDIGFAQDMSLHHEQALILARMALARSASPRVKLLAQGIVDEQLKEIGYLQGWLMLWNSPGVADTDDMAWMKIAYARAGRRDPAYEQFIASCVPGQGMPGAATPAQLEALQATAPGRFDQAFLALMVRHHQGAVVMARFASEYADSEGVRGVARAMAAEQQQEMAAMLQLLAAEG